jgi:hypothetical protein
MAFSKIEGYLFTIKDNSEILDTIYDQINILTKKFHEKNTD